MLLWSATACTAGADRLPPVSVAEVAPLYEDALADLGLHLTGRGGLVDTSQGYETSPEGTHLALYAAPVDDQDLDAYLDDLVPVTAMFAQDVFDRWPGLRSFDVCLEEFVADGPLGQTLIQVKLTRELAAGVDWDSVTLEHLAALAEDDEGSHVQMTGVLRRHRSDEQGGWGSGG